MFREGVFMLVMRHVSFFEGYAEQLILVGPVIEGLTGGLSTFNGVVHAYVVCLGKLRCVLMSRLCSYISDCTSHGSRFLNSAYFLAESDYVQVHNFLHRTGNGFCWFGDWSVGASQFLYLFRC
jgi:hypothetical protein